MGTVLTSIVLAFAGPVVAQAPRAAPLRIVLPLIEQGCPVRAASDDTIVVCGREDRQYRIDPAVLALTRSRDASRGPPRPDLRAQLFQETCSPVGPRGCSGRGILPVSSVALTLATALIKVARGEDLRPMLRATPSEYDSYKAAKAKTDAAATGKTPAPR